MDKHPIKLNDWEITLISMALEGYQPPMWFKKNLGTISDFQQAKKALIEKLATA